MSTNEKIEIKEAVDDLGMTVDRKATGLNTVNIKGGLFSKGVVLQTKQFGTDRPVVIALSREEAEELMRKMKYAIDISRKKEYELLQRRTIDFRLDRTTRLMFDGLAQDGNKDSLVDAVSAYINYALDTADYDAIKHSMLYKYASEEHPHSGLEDMVDELVSQFIDE